MFYFTPVLSSFVKDFYLKVSWQNVFFDHPGMQFEGQASHLYHWIRADQFLRLSK